jgi:hypothetical protein
MTDQARTRLLIGVALLGVGVGLAYPVLGNLQDTRARRRMSRTSPCRSPHTSAIGVSSPNTTTTRSIMMRIRFISWLTLAATAAFLVVATAAFTLPVIAALALGVGIGMLVVSLGIAYRYRDHIPTLVPALLSAVVSAWMIIASQVFSQASVQNLTLGESLAIGGLALAGLTAHELSTERVVHSLQVSAGHREEQPATA